MKHFIQLIFIISLLIISSCDDDSSGGGSSSGGSPDDPPEIQYENLCNMSFEEDVSSFDQTLFTSNLADEVGCDADQIDIVSSPARGDLVVSFVFIALDEGGQSVEDLLVNVQNVVQVGDYAVTLTIDNLSDPTLCALGLDCTNVCGGTVALSFCDYPDITCIDITDEFGNIINQECSEPSSACWAENLYSDDFLNEEGRNISSEWVISEDVLPTENKLESIYPNPFNPIFTISMSVAEASDINIFIINEKNEVVCTIASDLFNTGIYNTIVDINDCHESIAYDSYRLIADFGEYECFENIKYSPSEDLGNCYDHLKGHWVANGDVVTITEDLGGCDYDVGYSWSLAEEDQSDWNVHLDNCGHLWESETDITTYECSDGNITAYLTEDDGTPYEFFGSYIFSDGNLIITQNVEDYAGSGCNFTLDTTLEFIESVNDCVEIDYSCNGEIQGIEYDGYLNCSGDGNCCPIDWLDDGECDGENQCYDCDMTCYDNDGGDCDGIDPGEEECYYDNVALVDDCDGSDDSCPSSWIGDGYCDDEEQLYGCDLTCYDNDGGDCGDRNNNETKPLKKILSKYLNR